MSERLSSWPFDQGDPTLADAIRDRLVHNACRITLEGESLRKRKAPELTAAATCD